VLLPGADHTTLGVQARLDRLEKRAAISGTPSAEARPESTPAAPAPTPAPQPQRPTAPEAEAAPEPERPVAEPAPTAEPEPAPAAPAGAQLSLVDVRRLWPDIVDATKQRRRVTWIHLTQNAQVVAVDATTLTLGFANVGARESFEAGGSAEIVRQAAIDVVGADWKIETIVDPAADASAAPPPAAPEPEPAPAPPAEPATAPASNAAREAVRETRSVDTAPEPDQHLADADADAHPDDVDADSDEAGGTDLLQRELGAQMIEEIPHS
jgi:DNA polymerase-3 subunit gamma/tau